MRRKASLSWRLLGVSLVMSGCSMDRCYVDCRTFKHEQDCVNLIEDCRAMQRMRDLMKATIEAVNDREPCYELIRDR
jgi:hypothetical protein